MGFSMFDWPEHSQTSPMRTLVNAVVSPASMVRVCGVNDAGSFPSFISQRPFASARVDFDCFSNLTVMVAPGALQPQTGMGCCRCSTMLSPKMAGSFRVAEADVTLVSAVKANWETEMTAKAHNEDR